MKIRLKKRGVFGLKKFDLNARIEKVEPILREGFPEVKAPGKLAAQGKQNKKEGFGIFVKGVEGIGVISFGSQEIERLIDAVKRKANKKVVGKTTAKRKRKRK